MAEAFCAGAGNAGSFASLLASFTGSGRANDSWDDSALADDVANISYEQALRSLRREPPAESSPARSARVVSSAPVSIPTPSDHKERKTASITIRLSEAEQVQLRERAGEARLSMSVYLRSCIFEAEKLRAQVKEALFQMQAGSSEAPQVSNTRQTSLHRRFFFLPWRQRRGA